jgi:flagellar basal-body rod protein FlgC
VHVQRIVEDPSPFTKRYDPGHVDAIPTGPDAGYVLFPNVDLNTEMVDAIEAARVYEANVTVLEVTKSMANTSLRLLA